MDGSHGISFPDRVSIWLARFLDISGRPESPIRPLYLALFPLVPLILRDYRQQNIGLFIRPGVQGYSPPENFGRPITRIVVTEYPATVPVGVRAALHAGIARIYIVRTANGERYATAFGHNDAGWPNLNVNFIRFSGLERLFFIIVCRQSLLDNKRL